ncbi:MAG: branched-chain amino acid aminotransferase [Bacteroidetes bacterium]|nr:branched-chain amino acid aminotransferase [Bacteroidota bacterium]MBX7130314.1 branched-chain amino acid aminotransferase [Flavobacteriales bacterium]MCC6655558.1 branched-chain amino acid aminotransferase [Flavobacteriales bacterium]HMU14738.1 branched-chain amino acid aminotransferase [Flavobacteriales bacterium]HMZ48540.1 branched-chain amino acid aminotransferase [Flavobacteriales bacterium]
MITLGQKIDIQPVKHSRLPATDLNQVKFGRVFSDHMFVMDYVDGQWREPRIVEFSDLRMSPAALVLHYAQTIFEGLKAYRSMDGSVKLFRPEMNIKRMNLSAHRMCMPALPEDLFLDALKTLIRMDKGWIPSDDEGALYIRPFMYASDEYIGVKPSDNYRFIIFTCPVRNYYKDTVRVKVETKYSRAFPGGTGEAKCGGNYAASLYPAQLAQREGFEQLLWTDGEEHAYFEESGTMNVFFRIDDTMLTPATTGSILHGVTRDSIIRIAQHEKVPIEVRRITVKEVVDALKQGRLKAAFGAGTAATIAHIRSIAYEGITYDLPPVEERNLSNHLGQVLDDIRRGRIADPFGWMVPVE